MLHSIFALAFVLGATAAPMPTEAPVVADVVIVRAPEATPAPQLPVDGDYIIRTKDGKLQIGGVGELHLPGDFNGEAGGVVELGGPGLVGFVGHIDGNIGPDASLTAGGDFGLAPEGCLGVKFGAGVTICAPNPSPTVVPGDYDSHK